MKKILAALVLLTYLAFSSGIVVSLHYCMDRFDSVAFGASDEDECGKCGMDKSETNDNGCCKDEHKQLKLDVDHKIAVSTFDHLQLVAIAEPVSFIEIPAIAFSSIRGQGRRH